MKLHLPCALRSALIACFALACTTTVWAGELVKDDATSTATFSGDQPDAILTVSTTSYTLKADADGTSGTLGNINIKENTTLKLEGFSNLTLSSIKVEKGVTLTLEIDGNTNLTLTDVNIPSGAKVYYNLLGQNSVITMSANDCQLKSVTGSGTINFNGGVVNATGASGDSANIFTWDTDILTSFMHAEFDAWCKVYNSSTDTLVTYNLTATQSAPAHINGPGTKGGDAWYESDMTSGLTLDLKMSGHVTIPVDGEVSMYDPDSVGRVTENGEHYWHLNKNASIQDMMDVDGDGKLPDHTDTEHENPDVKLADSDFIRFAGGTLTSSEDVVIANEIVRAKDNNADCMVKLAPAAGTTMTFTNGDGALMTGGVTKNDNGTPDNEYDDYWVPDTTKGLELSGGAYSTVVLQNISDAKAEPTNIHFTTDNTALYLSGPDTITLDSTKNSFKSTTTLGKELGGTLVYKTKTSDSIGMLHNEEGTIEIARAIDSGTLSLKANTLRAETIKLAGTNLHVTADHITAGDIDIKGSANGASSANKLTTKNLYATGTVELGSYSTLSASGYAEVVNVRSEATLTGSSLYAGTVNIDGECKPYPEWPDIVAKGGKVTVGHQSTTGEITITAPATEGTTPLVASIEDMALNSLVTEDPDNPGHYLYYRSTFSASSVSNAVITSVSNDGDNIFLLGTVTDSTMDVDKAAIVTDTDFVNTDLTVGTGSILNNTSHDANSDITFKGGNNYSANAQLNNVSLAAGTTLNVGAYPSWSNPSVMTDGTLYDVSADGITVTGTVNRTMNPNTAVVSNEIFEITSLFFEQDAEAEMSGEAIISSSNGGTVKMADNYSETLYTAAGWVGSLAYENGQLVFSQTDKSEEIIDSLMSSENVREVTPILVDSAKTDGGVMKELYDYVRDTTRATQDDRQKALNALASGSLTMLADSQRQGVTHTINRLRNRVVQMGNPQGIEWEKNIHAWIEADGSYNDIDQDGGNAGYEYQTWGGTVGVHADAGNLSFGAAISAAYGDLTSHADDRAEGDHNSYSLSAFVRHQSGSWMQMGILSFGRNELEVERTIDTPRHYGESKSYRGEGDASGHTITAYYEAGYTISLNEDATQVIQPLVSVMLTSARMGDYTETGSIGNAGMNIDTEDYVYGTVGIGARYQVVLAEDVNERFSFLELRAKLVQDFGDETDEVTVSFSGVPGQSFIQRGADVGRTGFQFGAGLSVPLGIYETFFADVDADIRSGATSVNGSVGVRVEF